MIRSNVVAFACGMKGSGKSHWLYHTFVVGEARVIHIDPAGDYVDDGNVLLVDGYPGLLDALDCFATRNTDRWRVAVSLTDPNDVAELFRLLAPEENFGKGSLARALKGVAVECGECDVVAPNGRTAPEVQSAWRRGRHHRLNLLMGTQRPSACDRLVTSQADIVACFRLDEPRDQLWVKDKLGRAAALEIANLPDYWHLEKQRAERELRVVDPRGRVVRRLPLLATAAPSKRAARE